MYAIRLSNEFSELFNYSTVKAFDPCNVLKVIYLPYFVPRKSLKSLCSIPFLGPKIA